MRIETKTIANKAIYDFVKGEKEVVHRRLIDQLIKKGAKEEDIKIETKVIDDCCSSSYKIIAYADVNSPQTTKRSSKKD